jgi:hypothetical protein
MLRSNPQGILSATYAYCSLTEHSDSSFKPPDALTGDRTREGRIASDSGCNGLICALANGRGPDYIALKEFGIEVIDAAFQHCKSERIHPLVVLNATRL